MNRLNQFGAIGIDAFGVYSGQNCNRDPLTTINNLYTALGNQRAAEAMLSQQNYRNLSMMKGLQDVNASTETVYPKTNGNSMNKKLEAAKKWLKDKKGV